MNLFNLSSVEKMVLFSELNNPRNDSFLLKFRKDFDLNDFDYLKPAIEIISKNYLTLQITHDENGDFKQYYADIDNEDIVIESFEVAEEDIDDFIKNYLDDPFDDIFDSPLYKWAVLKTDSSSVLIGVLHHILLDGTSLFTIIPREIERCIESLKNNENYLPIDYSYETYVEAELDYLKSAEANEDNNTIDTMEEELKNDVMDALEGCPTNAIYKEEDK